MAFGAISILASRSATVDFSAPYYYSSFSLMAKKKPNSGSLSFSSIDAFSLEIWVMLVLMVVLASIALVGDLHETLTIYFFVILFD